MTAATPQEKLMFYWDLAERALNTLWQAYIVAWIAVVEINPNAGYTLETLFSTTTLKAAFAGAVLAVAKGFLAKRVTNGASASFLPTKLDPPSMRQKAAAAGPQRDANGRFTSSKGSGG